MFPLRDMNPTRVKPVVTVLIIAVNLAVFFLIQSRGSETDQQILVYRRAAISCEVSQGSPLTLEELNSGRCSSSDSPAIFPEKNVWLALAVSMFLHGSTAHVVLNMWFLWIFGNNVEEAYGPGRYLLLYLLGGLFATVAFVGLNPASTVPLIGASGAIAVVMGSYAVLFPRQRIWSLLGWLFIPVPAVLFLGIWFVTQFGIEGTAVAWEAHAAGFVFGALVSLVARKRLLRRVAVA